MKIKQYFLILTLYSCFLLNCSENKESATQKEGFYINAKLNLPKSTKGMLITLKGYQEFEVDSFDVDSTGFLFYKKIDPSNDNKVYTLSFPELDYNINLFISSGDSISLHSIQPNLSDIIIKGAPLQKKIDNYFSQFDNILKEIDSIQQVLYYYQNSKKTSPKFLKKLKSTLYELNGKFHTIDSTYLAQNINSKIIPFILFNKYINVENGIATIQSILDQLPEENKNNFYIRLISTIEGNKLSIGKKMTFPDDLTDVEGKVIKINDLKAPIIMIDFWASWCVPCRKQNPELVRIYNTYKNKGFEIVSISLDHKKEDWVGAIKNDKLNWIHVSTLQGWDNPLVNKHFISSIPYNIILNEEHEIIAINLSISQLEELLKGL